MTKTHHAEAPPPAAADPRAARIRAALSDQCIVLVGMMGSGKTAIGSRLAARLGLPFVDADAEIAAAARLSIPEIFARFGESYFRDGERRVMFRLLHQGPAVVATGGGAFMNPRTRQRVRERGVSLWLDADHETLLKRVRRKNDRPLLQTADPAATLRKLMDERNPIYALADLRVVSRDDPQDVMVEAALDALDESLPALNETKSKESPTLMTQYAPHPYPAPGAPEHRESVRVALGDRSYDIVIGSGLLAEAGERIAALAPDSACAIVSDKNVAPLYLPALEASLKAAGLRSVAITVEPGEGSKTLSVFGEVLDNALAAKIERRDVVVALGGGVVGDLAGFVAASLRRGARFVQIPTSLLAQVDSSVGGKTGVNSRHGKNLIGAFHQPSLVLADVDALETLPLREFRAGYAEVVKYGLIGDRRFFEWLEADGDAVFRSKPEQICAIAVSCKAKARIVARDETEQGDRALLNLGHTFGHALERLVDYDNARLVHGEGVAIGLVLAMRFSRALGFCPAQDAMRVERHLQSVGLPTRISDIPGWSVGPEAILEAMFQDKKVERGALTFVLARGIGEAFVEKSIEADKVRAFLQGEL
ncbi:MAG TPA: 3-dehydroquinate synthase [Methylocystis sp.]|nr:3-dehydroquinate synthase [Methylocystis sp.]